MFKISSIVLLLATVVIANEQASPLTSELNNVTISEVISAVFSLLKDDSTQNALSRVDASLKSTLGSPLTGLVYAASVAAGVVTGLAFYDSPNLLSNLLPKAPQVGRYPPGHPIWATLSQHLQKVNQANINNNGAAYATSASHPNPVYTMPNIQDQNQFSGYQKTQLSQGFGLTNGINQVNNGNFQTSSSNVQSSVVFPPQNYQRVSHNVQPNNRSPVLQQRKSDILPSVAADDKVKKGSVVDGDSLVPSNPQ